MNAVEAGGARLAAVILRVRHDTRFTYADTVTHSYSEARLLPRTTPSQTVRAAHLAVDPAPDDRSERVDHFGNRVVFLSLARPHSALAVTAEAEVEVRPAEVGAAAFEPWEAAAAAARMPGAAAAQFALASPLVEAGPDVENYARRSFPAGRPLAEAAAELTERIYTDLEYRPGSTSVRTSVGEVMARRRGVCQDFAHFQIACLRSLGLAARYVSGHLETLGPDGRPELLGAGASHAWCAVALPGGTWLDLDPTNRLVAPPTHVTLAWGRDYGDVAPLKGVIFTEGGHTLSVTVTVTRV